MAQRKLGPAFLCVLAFAAASTPAQETLSRAEQDELRKGLPEAIQAADGALKEYLQALQERRPGAGADAGNHTTAICNAVRVARDLKTAGAAAAPFACYVVPPMSDLMRLSDCYPEDGRVQAEIQVVAAKDEFEPASFVIFPFQDAEKVEFKVGALSGPHGATLPPGNLDLKVVKIWYQNANGWFSYFDDSGLALVPELLLNDENLVKVDTAAQANYARVDAPGGSRLVWISAPKHLETQTFRPAQEPFADAQSLQPVALKAGEFKQFMLTVNVPKTAAEGVYRGTIGVSAGGRRIGQLSLAVRVLPFVLPNAATFFDLEKGFITSIMGSFTLETFLNMNGGDVALAREQREAVLRNLRRHGILHPSGIDQDAETVALAKTIGFATKPWFGKSFLPWFGKNFGGRMTFDEHMASKIGAQKCRDFYMKLLGHTDILLGHGDEQGAAFVACHRDAFTYYHEYGLKIGCAGHGPLLYKGGYTYSLHPFGGFPDEVERIRPWNLIGDRYVGFYAGQHIGSENPAFVRRQQGLLGYLSNCSMLYNYEFAYGPWNDRANDTYKPMVLAYMTRSGLVDTLGWEGFREGIDDMRYATRLLQLAKEAIASGSTERMLEGRKARQYLALLDGGKADLNATRAEMTHYILKLSGSR